MDTLDFFLLLKTIIFICGTLFGASYAIPKGIEFYQDWKQKKEKKLLASAITYISYGVMILVFFLVMLIFEALK